MKTHNRTPLFFLSLFYLIFTFSQGFAFVPLEPNKFIYFENQSYQIKEEETLVDLAVKFNIGYTHLVLANPEVDPWIPPPGKEIILPYQILIPEEFLLKDKAYILINLPEMRLYYFRTNSFKVYPIGIGDEGKLPPLGKYIITRKQEKPFWYPPPSIRAEDPTLPKVVPPGPDNPMGDYALYLNKGLYAIHGTNKPESIGRRTTHGCIRLYPEDIKTLWQIVPLNLLVYIIYEPFKIALMEDKIYLQAFPDIETLISNPFIYILNKLDKLTASKGMTYQINLLVLEKILEKPDGLVHEIGKLKKLSSYFRNP
ncbi:MAG: L,D-transpeptidase family protein [Caldimicrobium sp.]